MALIDKRLGVCIVDEVNGDELRALFDDAKLVHNKTTKVTTGEWMEPSDDGEGWVYRPMTSKEVCEYMSERNILGFAH